MTAAESVIKAAHLPGVGASGAERVKVIVGHGIEAKSLRALKAPRFRNRDVGAVAA